MSNIETRRSLGYRLAYPWVKTLLIGMAQGLAPRFGVTGENNVPRRGGVLLCPNHLSDSDPPFLYRSCPRPLWFMAKSEIFDMELIPGLKLGPPMRFFGAFPVERGEPDREALRHSENLLKSGQVLVVFPEGQCSETTELLPMLPGAVMIALRANVPVVPVGIWGTQHVMPYGKVIARPTLKNVHVHFGKPLRFDDVKALPRREQREAAAVRLEEAIRRARDVAMKGGQ